MSRWPASMRLATAMEYLDTTRAKFYTLKIPSVKLNGRGESVWLKSDLDAYLENQREQPANGTAKLEQRN